jgi:hypothetical protein
MTFIDWSDPEEMLGLLTEYVADARNESDGERSAYLGALLSDLTELNRHSDAPPLDELAAGLRRVHASHARDLAGDEVLRHVEDCLDELDRIRDENEPA